MNTSSAGPPPEWGRKRGCLTATIVAIVVFLALLGVTIVVTYRGYKHSVLVGDKAAREQRIAQAQAGEVEALKQLLEDPELSKELFKGTWNAFEFSGPALELLSRFGPEATPAMVGALADNGSPRVDGIAAVSRHLAKHDPELKVAAAEVFSRPAEFSGLLLRRYREFAIVKGRRVVIEALADFLIDPNPWNAYDPYDSRNRRVCDIAAEAIAVLAGPENELPVKELQSSAIDVTRRDPYVQQVASWIQSATPESWPLQPAGWVRIKANRLAMASDGRRKLTVSLTGGPSRSIIAPDNPVMLVFGPLPVGAHSLVLVNQATKKTITKAVTLQDGVASEVSADFDEL